MSPSTRPGRFSRYVIFITSFLILSAPIVVLMTILTTIFALLRLIVWVLAKLFQSDFEGFVTDINSVFALRTANFPLNIVGVAVVNGPIDINLARQHFEERVLSLKRPNGELLYDKLKKTWTRFLGYPVWKRDENFNLNNHIRPYDYTFKTLPPAPSEDDLQDLVGGLISQPWKKGHSPWEILLISNYNGESKTVQMIRIDHVLSDGVSIYELYKLFTRSGWQVPNIKFSETLSMWQRLVLNFKMPGDLMLTGMLSCHPATYKLPFQSAGVNQIIFSVSPEIPVDVIKQIKGHFKVSYAAVCYAGMCGAIVKALENAGEKIPRSFITGIILPKPNHPGGLVIHAYITTAKLPLRSSSSEKRLLEVHKAFARASKSTAPLAFTGLGKLVTLFPSFFWSALVISADRLANINVSTAFMPVTTAPDYYEGMEVSELTIGNSLIGSVGMMISLGGVNNKQRISFCVHKSMFQSEDIAKSLGTYVADEIQNLVDAMV